MLTSIENTITFGREGNAQSHLSYGWFVGEDQFNWTLGDESLILLPKVTAKHGGFVEMDVHPLAHAGAPARQRLRVLVNGVSVGAAAITSSTWIGFPFAPPSRWDPSLAMTIQHPDAFAIGGHGASRLAFAFRKVRVLSLQEPLPSPTFRRSQVSLVSANTSVQALIAAAEAVTQVSIHNLLTRFQLVAGDCEFGGVQRACGSEPLSLLRFAGASPRVAVRGLDCSFDGIGKDLEPNVAEHGAREWMMRDHAYSLNYHTRMSANDVPYERVLVAERRKVAFLRRKLLEDLVTPGTIFVCADRHNAPPEAMHPLFMALNRHGPNRLLWIVPAEASADVGLVEEHYPGLMRGYIDRFVPHKPGAMPSMQAWLTLLTNAFILGKEQ